MIINFSNIGGGSGGVNSGAVQTQINQSISALVATASYVSSAHTIYFYSNSGNVVSSIDATDFIKDGMVSDAYVSGTNLVITFNTDSGKENIVIPLSSIFPADSYYTKTEIDNKGYLTTADTQVYLTSADTGNFATSADIKTITDHIEESEEVISTAINDLNSRIASGGSGSNQIVYVDNLNFSGETDKIYMYKNQMYRWTTSAGTLATFVGLNPDTANQDPNVGVVHYDYIPQSFDGALMFRYYYTFAESDAMYVYYDFTNDRLLSFHGEQSNPLTATPDFTFYKETKYELTQWNNGIRKLSFYWTDGVVTFKQENSTWYINIANLNKLTVNGPHFELVDRNIRVYSSNWQFSGTTNDNNVGMPVWNSQGIITGKNGDVFPKQVRLNFTGFNGSSYFYMWSYKNESWTHPSNGAMFFPTVGGNSGEILKSVGNGEPTWVTLASLMGGLTIVQCSESDYENMATHDGSTLYIIDPEAE